jgi:hypothetical protein
LDILLLILLNQPWIEGGITGKIKSLVPLKENWQIFKDPHLSRFFTLFSF